MKIAFVINDLITEKAFSTTPLLMWQAHNRGHDVFVMSVGDFSYSHHAAVCINGVTVSHRAKIKSADDFLIRVRDKKAKKEKLVAQDIDVLFLRNNPTEEESGRYWAEHAGVAFGRMMQNQGILVLNDAYALSNAFIDKLYFEELPSEIKPDSIITRSAEEIMEFYEKQNKKMVLKPLEGSGGQNVYLIDKHEKNINQIISTISHQGYVIAQEFIPEVKEGDIRVILMNGRVLEEDGHQAMIKRVSSDDKEFRSNFSLGATADKAEMTDAIQRIIDVTAPKLIRDGLFLVGLDVVKDKLIEINVLSPGGLRMCEKIGIPNFSDTIIKAIERKVEYKKMYENRISNRALATMA